MALFKIRYSSNHEFNVILRINFRFKKIISKKTFVCLLMEFTPNLQNLPNFHGRVGFEELTEAYLVNKPVFNCNQLLILAITSAIFSGRGAKFSARKFLKYSFQKFCNRFNSSAS